MLVGAQYFPPAANPSTGIRSPSPNSAHVTNISSFPGSAALSSSRKKIGHTKRNEAIVVAKIPTPVETEKKRGATQYGDYSPQELPNTMGIPTTVFF